MTVPRGPAVHKPSPERVMLKLDEIQNSMIQLQFRVRTYMCVCVGVPDACSCSLYIN